MDKLEVNVSVFKRNGDVKVLKENYQENLSSLIMGLKRIKQATNDYLTDLVNEEKANSNGSLRNESNRQIHTAAQEEDDECEEDVEDFIDSEIKREINNHESSSSCDSINQNDKRTKTKIKKSKKVKN